MRPSIRLAFITVFLIFTALHLFAGQVEIKPVYSRFTTFKNLLRIDSFRSVSVIVFNAEKPADKPNSTESNNSATHICSCQILHLKSSNYDQRDVAVFAEKTNNGSSADYAIAKSRIQKEKKLMKHMFYDKVKVVSELQGTGSCKSMFFRLKTANSNIQLYDILNADIQ